MAYVLESLPDKPAQGFVLESLPEPRTTGEKAARGAGLGARATIKGVLGIPMAMLDAGIGIGNAINRGTNALGLTDAAQFPSASELTDALMTKAGLAEPETPGERIASDVQAGATGGGAMATVAKALAGKVAPGVEKAVLEILAKLPGMQTAAGATSAGAAGVAREEGAGPVGQLAAGVAGGLAAPAAVAGGQTLASAGRALREVHKPFTQAGRENIVGTTLRRLANDPRAAAENMATGADELVPGSLPTTAQAARDPGLLAAERAMASSNPQFAARQSANNAARNRALDSIAGTADDLKAATAAREAQGKQLYSAAFDQPLRPDAPIEPLINLSKRPAFQAAIKKAAEIAREQGDDQLDIMLDPKGLHYIKLALDDTLDTAPQSGVGKAQQRAIAQTRADFLGWLEDAHPAYAKAKSAYAQASKPVNQMETGQAVRDKTRLAGPDVTGEPIISQAKWQNAVTQKLDELSESLTPEQVKTLQTIGADLDRGSLSMTAGRAAGSNTFQNLSTANVIGAALGGQLAESALMKTLARPLGWLYKLPEPQVQDLLTQAMLDPKLARALMAKGSPQNVDFTLAALKDKARLMGLLSAAGTTTGTATSLETQQDR